MSIDFKSLPQDGSQFEELIHQLLEAMGYRVLEKPAIGTEGGRDILIERTLKDAFTERRERVVVQCKHTAHGGRAVGDADVGLWQNAMHRYKARGYLLVTSTRVTENLSRAFREYTEDEANSPRWAAFWNAETIVQHLDEHSDIVQRFFPRPPLGQITIEHLASEIRTWLEAVRYKTTSPEITSERTLDFFAEMDVGTIRQRILVRCVGGRISHTDVVSLYSKVTPQTPQGWLISDYPTAAEIKSRASLSFPVIRISSLAEFLEEYIWNSYVSILRATVESEKIPERYVAPGCYTVELDAQGNEVARNHYGDIEVYIDRWLKARGKIHISVLGAFGAGKTWFCRHYAYKQLARYLQDPSAERFPLLINLRTFAKSTNAKQLINDALLEQYKLPFVGSAYNVFQNLNSAGKILLILDGFDEMAQLVDYQTVVDNFWELATLVGDSSKIILTSRTEYFRWAKESEKILGGGEVGRRAIQLRPPRFDVLYVESLNASQIEEIIIRRQGPIIGKAAAKQILSNPDLAEMAKKPVLIGFLLATLDEATEGLLKKPSDVYLYATSRLLLRNIETQKTFTGTGDKIIFLCELAWEMFRKGELRIHFKEIPETIKRHFGGNIANQRELDAWDYDLRSQTLLHRTTTGYYEFSHRSLVEYFVAYKLAAELGCLERQFIRAYFEPNPPPSNPPIIVKELAGLVESWGFFNLADPKMSALRELLGDMVSSDADERLLSLVFATKGKPPAQVGYVGGNSLTLLNDLGLSLPDGIDFSDCSIRGAELTGLNLQGSKFDRSDLSGIRIYDTYLEGASMRGALMNGAKIYHIGGVKSVAFGATSHQLYSSSSDGEFVIWDFSSPGERQCSAAGFYSVNDIRFSVDGTLAVGRAPGGATALLHMPSGRPIRFLKGIPFWFGAAFSPDNSLLLTAGENVVYVWNVGTGRMLHSLEIKDVFTSYAVGFSPNGRMIVASHANGGAVVWTVDGQLIASLTGHGSKVEAACFSKSGHHVVTGGYDDKINVWSTKDWTLVGQFDEVSAITDIVASPVDDIVAVATHAGVVALWSLVDMKCIGQMQAHKGSVYTVGFSPDGSRLASGGWDGMARIWSMPSGQCVVELPHGLHYSGLDLRGAQGAPQKTLKLLADRGALLDDEQRALVDSPDEVSIDASDDDEVFFDEEQD